MPPERAPLAVRRRRFAAAIALSLLLSTPLPAAASPAGWAAAGSLLLPGSGQLANGELGKAAAHLGIYLGASVSSARLRNRSDYIELDERYDDDAQQITTNRTSEWADLASRSAVGTMFYSSYDAYRSRRLASGNHGYRTAAPAEGLGELALAPFQPRFFTRWTTLVPISIAASTLAFSVDPDAGWVTQTEGSLTRGEAALYVFPQHGAVALGEEVFFRGVLNNSFSHQWGPRWGLGASSLAFGLAHSGDGLSAQPLIATGFGAYLGWLQQRNDYRIAEGVAIHFWWNVFISLAALRHDPDDRTAEFSLSVPFH